MTEKIKILKIIHLAIFAGIVLAYIFAGEISMEQLQGQKIGTEDLIFLLIPIGTVLLSNFLFKNQLKQIDPKASEEQKMATYQTASLIQWAILEGGAFIILFLVPNIMVVGILLIIYLAYLRPTEDKVRNYIQYNF